MAGGELFASRFHMLFSVKELFLIQVGAIFLRQVRQLNNSRRMNYFESEEELRGELMGQKRWSAV